MRFFCLPVLYVALVSFASAGEPNARTVKFQDENYELAFVQEARGEVLNEFVPQGETLEDWSSLLSVHVYPQRTDYKLLAGNLITALKQKNPLAQAALHTSADGKRSMVDFVTWAGAGEGTITEFNVFIYQLGADGKSTIAHQYAERAYGQDEGLEFMRKLKNRRIKLLESVGQFKFPAVTTQPIAAE
jgi:hypothetical protein